MTEYEMPLELTVGRDYRSGSQYEYCLYEGEELVARRGFFPSYASAKRAGVAAARAVYAERGRVAPELPLE